MTTEKGLICEIYKQAEDDYDCTNGGMSSKHTKVTLVGKDNEGNDIARVFEVADDCPAVRLEYREIMGKTYVSAIPVNVPKGLLGPMFGGNFIYSCDSRFPSDQPIPIHDRFETQADYNRLSQ